MMKEYFKNAILIWHKDRHTMKNMGLVLAIIFAKFTYFTTDI